MKILVIPDTHLKKEIFKQAAYLMQNVDIDQVVVLGDLADGEEGKEYPTNLYRDVYEELIVFVKKYPATRICYGNHDISYVWRRMQSRYDFKAEGIVRLEMMKLQLTLGRDNPIKFCHLIDNVLFSHAGLTESFVEKYTNPKIRDNPKALVNRINQLDEREMWDSDSPIWFRPRLDDRKLYREDSLLQVVGHTPVEKITTERNGRLICTDVFSHPACTNQRFLYIDTKTLEYALLNA